MSTKLACGPSSMPSPDRVAVGALIFAQPLGIQAWALQGFDSECLPCGSWPIPSPVAVPMACRASYRRFSTAHYWARYRVGYAGVRCSARLDWLAPANWLGVA